MVMQMGHRETIGGCERRRRRQRRKRKRKAAEEGEYVPYMAWCYAETRRSKIPSNLWMKLLAFLVYGDNACFHRKFVKTQTLNKNNCLKYGWNIENTPARLLGLT